MDPFEVLDGVLSTMPNLLISFFFAQCIPYSSEGVSARPWQTASPSQQLPPSGFNAELVKYLLIQDWNPFTNCFVDSFRFFQIGSPAQVHLLPSICHLVITMASSSLLGAGVRRGQHLSVGKTHTKENSRWPLRLCFRISSVMIVGSIVPGNTEGGSWYT